MTLDDVPHAVEDGEEGVDESHELEEVTEEGGGDVHGEVLHDETGEHHANVQQDGLHGVVAQKVVQLDVAHHGEKEGEEGDKGDEAVGVEDLQQRGDRDGNLEGNGVHHKRLIRKRDGAHARDQIGEQREEAKLQRRADLFVFFWVWDWGGYRCGDLSASRVRGWLLLGGGW